MFELVQVKGIESKHKDNSQEILESGFPVISSPAETFKCIFWPMPYANATSTPPQKVANTAFPILADLHEMFSRFPHFRSEFLRNIFN